MSTIKVIGILAAVVALAGCGSSASPPSSGVPASVASVQNHLHSIAIVPDKPDDVYFGAHYFLYHSDDGGKHWARLTHQMMLSLSLDTKHPSTLYAVSLQHGLVVTHDGGKTWSNTRSKLPKGQVTGVVVDAALGTVFAFGSGIYRSTDGGAQWTRSHAGSAITGVAAGAGKTVFAATGNGLLISRNGGAQWSASKAIGNQPVVQVVGAGTTSYAVTAIELMKSTDNGSSWTAVKKAPVGIEFIGVSPGSPTDVVAEVAQRGFYATTNGGMSWKKTSGIHDNKFTGATVQLAATNPNVGYTGSWGMDVYTTTDGGLHWKETATLKS